MNNPNVPKITFFCEKCNKEKRIVQFLYCNICNKMTLEEVKQSLCQWCGETAKDITQISSSFVMRVKSVLTNRRR